VWRIGLLAPFVLGIIAWLTFDRRDLAGSTP
jgi:hypothetical protein